MRAFWHALCFPVSEVITSPYGESDARKIKNYEIKRMDAQWTIVIGITLQRNGLETQWEQSEKVSTEDLRLSLRRYHSFFERLLSI